MLELIEPDKEEDGIVPSDKGLFESRDPGTASSGVGEPRTTKYMGQERRRNDRRQYQDRREDVRFEVDKDDRREKPGRREGDTDTKFW